jgi:serine/threonine protein kinase/Tol biopolymer transport system component
MPLSPGTHLGPYEVLALIGAGGMGEVYRARDPRLEREVAIKVLPHDRVADEHRRQRFIREAKAASALNHPHIVTIHEIESANGIDFIVMEYVRGKSLDALIPRQGMRLGELVRIAIPVADALGAAHARGIVHRDLKPANVMVGVDGAVKVLDFGLAKLTAVETAPDEETITAVADLGLSAAGMIMGTAAYMSPEQATGGQVDARSDIFSFGAMLYEMATGTRAFGGSSVADTLAAVLRGQPTPPTQVVTSVPRELERLILRCLRKEPERRYQTMLDVKNELQEIKEESDSGGRTAAESPRPTRRWRWLAAATVAAAALVAVGAWWAKDRTSSPSAPKRTMTRLTFQDGLQTQPTWSPDGRLIAYASDRSGNMDIWVQPVSGGEAVQVTRDPADDTAPAWSPDGQLIAFRSERSGGGIYVVAALGGQERRLSAVGQRPRWSPDGLRLLCSSETGQNELADKHAYVVALDGGPPKEVLPEFFAGLVKSPSIGWHPDGERISIWGEHKTLGPGFWTARLREDGSPILSEGSVEPIKKGYWFWWYMDFIWAPSGDVIYFTGQVPNTPGVLNVYRVDVDPKTLRWLNEPVQLTNGAGPDAAVSISGNGHRLAFSSQHQEQRVWSFVLDANGRIDQAGGQPVTPAGVVPLSFDVSTDGRRLLLVNGYTGGRREPPDLRERDLATGTERVVSRTVGPWQALPLPRWSPDGKRIAFIRWGDRDAEGRAQGDHTPRLVRLDADTGEEHIIPDIKGFHFYDFYGFSPDGRSMIVNAGAHESDLASLTLSPTVGEPGSQPRRIEGTPPALNVWHPSFSPTGRWLAVVASPVSQKWSSIYVGDLSGRDFVRVTDDSALDDWPVWSGNGRTLYFTSNRGGLVNVWATGFDAQQGRAVGSPDRVTTLRNPMFTPMVGNLRIARDRLMMTLTETSGHIWMIDNVR